VARGKDEPDVTDAFTPEAALERTVDEGARRMQRRPLVMLATGLVGGIDVATGVFALLLVEQATDSKLLGGLAFGIGFIALLLARSELFTENFLVPVVAVVAGHAPPWRLGWLWLSAAVGNLAGGWLVTLLVIEGSPQLRSTAIKVADTYANYGYGWRAFCLALLGGLVITLMTWMQQSSQQIGGKIVAAEMTAFLLGAATLDHAIVVSLVMFSALHTGDATFGYSTWFATFLFASMGNIIGGVGLVTILRLLQAPDKVASEQRRAKATR
jgi:formate/nitrite transporter FocA (FNT family)